MPLGQRMVLPAIRLVVERMAIAVQAGHRGGSPDPVVRRLNITAAAEQPTESLDTSGLRLLLESAKDRRGENVCDRSASFLAMNAG